MSSKIFVLALAAFSAVGCSGIFVPQERYTQDVNQLKEYIIGLERANREQEPMVAAWARHKAECEITADAGRGYAELAESLKKALGGLDIEKGDFHFNPETGAFVFAESLLFDSGSFTLSAKGKEVLKRFAQANRGNHLRIVGYTDPVRVAKASTKSALDTDTNLELSVRRSNAVMGEFLKSGIAERSMWVEGRGATETKSSNKDSRRVEIFIVGGEVKTSQK